MKSGINKKRNLIFKTSSLLACFILVISFIHFAWAVEASLQYDQNGNMVKDETNSYEYDSQNQLIKIKNSTNGTIAAYFYDANNIRIKKIDYLTNTTTYYVDANFVRVVNSSGTYDTEYVYANSQLVARKDANGKKYFYSADYLGSTSIVMDEQGNVVERSEYRPYGEVISGGQDRYGFTGQEKDKESSLMYYGARYYSPALGKFIQADTIIQNVYDPQSLNRYAYARNNPLKYTDPSGHVWWLAAIAAGAFLLGTLATIASQAFSGQDIDVGAAITNGVKAAIVAGVAAVASTVAVAYGATAGVATLIGTFAGTGAGTATRAGQNLMNGDAVTQDLWNPESIAGDAMMSFSSSAIATTFASSSQIKPNVGSVDIKLNDYSLNTENSIGKHKARVFESALGYNKNNYGSLKDQIINNFDASNAESIEFTPYGTKYSQIMNIKGINGKEAEVVTAWMVNENQANLITAYVK